jgi:hypothetical protein
MSRVRSFRVGPGSLELISLRMWAVPRAHEGQARAVRAQATGSYTVYCGHGWDHTVDIDERHTFDLERPADELERRLATAWTEHNVGAANAAVAELVDWALEGWEDPCSWEEE